MDGGGQTTSSEPWADAQPYLRRGFEAANQFILDRPTAFFPGSTVVPFAPETEAGLQATTARALVGSPVLGAAQDYTQAATQGDYLSPYVPGAAGDYTRRAAGGGYLSPYVPGAAGDYTRALLTDPRSTPIYDAVLSEVRPGVDSAFALGGRTGSALHAEALGRGVSRALAPYMESAAGRAQSQYGLERGLQETAAGRAQDQYGRERSLMEAAAGRAPALAREDYYDIGQLGAVGSAREALAGKYLNDQTARWNFAQQEPISRTQQYMQALSGTPSLGGTSTTTQDKGAGQTLATITGLGLGAAGTAGGLGWQPLGA